MPGGGPARGVNLMRKPNLKNSIFGQSVVYYGRRVRQIE
nr:MAG TPA: hypothetical protein [Caudoviricetes sp.]